MNAKSIIFTLTVTTLVVVGCSKKIDPNVGGFQCLAKARIALQAGDTQTAKKYIDTLRIQYPMALNAREWGILVLDSVNLSEAYMQVSTIENTLRKVQLTCIGKDTIEFNLDEAKEKVKFFERKIEHDKVKKTNH